LQGGVVYNVWAKVTGPGGTKRVLSLGRRRLMDTIPPKIVSATMALSNPRPTRSISLSWNVTDNYAVESVYVLLSSTQATNPGASIIKSAGARFAPPSVSTAISGLRPLTTYCG
jgi:hypothetical protein